VRFPRIRLEALRRFPRSVAWRLAGLGLVATFCVGAQVAEPSPAWADGSSTSPYIVSDLNGIDSTLAAGDVLSVGGQVVESLDAAQAVLADLDPFQVFVLELIPGVVVTPDVTVSVQDTTGSGSGRAPAAVFPQETGATQLWSKGITGSGVNVAVLDTGIDPVPDLSGRLVGGVDLSGEGNAFHDSYGHGTFVAGLIASSGTSSGGQYTGEAPGAGLVSVKVAGSSGDTDMATVIEGVQWTIQHAKSLDIDVLNMSLGFVPFTSSVLNPLDQAVQSAWAAGITVVTSAGNAGPYNGTILSPGDDPMVITVGALDDMGTASTTDDTMTQFSSVGPTSPDGYYKPDLVTSGRSVVSLRAPGSYVDTNFTSAEIGTANFVGSGTSFSAAITSGAAALVLAAHPNDKPNDVKAALLASASAGPVGNPFVDGHGALDVAAAVAAGGVHLTQSYGVLSVSGSMEGNLKVNPGDQIRAGYIFTMPGKHPAAAVQFLASTVVVPLSCVPNSPSVGWVTIHLSQGPYFEGLNSNAWYPTGDQNSALGFQGSATTPDLCAGAQMYAPSAAFSGELISTDTSDSVQVKFHYQDSALTSGPAPGWSPPANTIPVSPTAPGATVNFTSTWNQSPWNTANWSGLGSMSSSATVPTLSGLAWNGDTWNGSAWNHLAWNGSAWNHLAWNGSAWNGSAWNHLAWNGSAWNGSAWNGSAWNGSAWN
jgi:serine protease AprX